MRYALGILGTVLAPILGAGYWVWMRIANRHTAAEPLTPDPDLQIDTPPRIVRGAKYVPVGAAAVTLGDFIYTRSKFPSTGLVRHEMIHVEQYDRWGFIPFFVRYGWDMGFHGYAASPIEGEARERSGTR